MDITSVMLYRARMRIRYLLGALVVFGSTACGGGSGTNTERTANSQPVASQAPDSSNPRAATSDVDCAGLEPRVSELLVAMQFVAQLKTPEDFKQLADKGTATPAEMKLDLDASLATLSELHGLDGYDAPPFGSPKADIDAIQSGFEGAKRLAAQGTPNQAEIDEFQTSAIGPVTKWVQHQASISAALSETCH